jgi:hypothetical protein
MSNRTSNYQRIRFASYLPKIAYHHIVTEDDESTDHFLMKEMTKCAESGRAIDTALLQKCFDIQHEYKMGLHSRREADLLMVDAGVPVLNRVVRHTDES